ncbi:MAG: P-type conjugative transfer protein TrbL [Rhizobiales bacterium]|nr:P-type conjugative transfer protein TrbL [Hyphomicrobiales bacterium]
MKNVAVVVVVAGIASLLASEPVVAQVQATVLDDLQQQITSAARSWEDRLLQAATSLFWMLAAIEIGLAAIWLAINAATLESWFAELVRRIMFIGFFAFVLASGPELAKAIVNSLWEIGSSSSGVRVSPADIFATGVSVNDRLSAQAATLPWQAFAQGWMMHFCGLLIIVAMGLFAAILLAVIIEMYVGLIAGMLLLGLGGSSFTKDFAIRYLVYAFSVGMKIMGLVVLAAIGSQILTNFSNDPLVITSASGPAMMAAVAFIMLILGVFVPGIIQGVVQGVSVGSGMEAIRSGSQAGRYGAAASGAAAGAALGVGGVAAGAWKAARAARASGSGVAGQAGAALKALSSVSSAGADKLMGIPGARMGSTLGLANQKLRDSQQGRGGNTNRMMDDGK